MIALNDLPTIIDGPGEYITRAGGRATIHEVKQGGNPETTRCDAKGSVWREFRGNFRPKGYAIWHISGRKYILKESKHDIVGRYADKAEAA